MGLPLQSGNLTNLPLSLTSHIHTAAVHLRYKESRDTCHLFGHRRGVSICLSLVEGNGWIPQFSADAWRFGRVRLLTHNRKKSTQPGRCQVHLAEYSKIKIREDGSGCDSLNKMLQNVNKSKSTKLENVSELRNPPV